MIAARSLRKRLIVALSVALVLASLSVALAAGSGPSVIPPEARVQGKSYSQWLATVWQDVIALAIPDNPLAGGGNGCVAGTHDNVLLVGTGYPTGGCDIPTGKMVVMVMAMVECSTVEAPPFNGADPAALAECVKQFHYSNLSMTIDGVPVANPDRFIVPETAVFPISYPADNILGVPGPGTALAMASGAIVLLPPLPPGAHTLETTGTITMGSYSNTITQSLPMNVLPGGK